MPLSAMSPAMSTASTPWSRNHSSVCLNVRLLPHDSIFSSAPTFVMWMSLTTPNVTFGLPASTLPAARTTRLPANAPNAVAPPMKNLLEMFMYVSPFWMFNDG